MMKMQDADGRVVEVTFAEREPFPVATFDGTCPSCGMTGSVQAVEMVQHSRTVEAVRDGVLIIDGHFEYGDGGDDEHLSCWSCAASWAMPKEVDYL